MGNDGGSIPTRRELVKEAARAPTVSELKATALENLSHAWTHDPLTLEPLDMENVVSDWRGRLYNYESILKGLVPGGDDKDDTAAPSNDIIPILPTEKSDLDFLSSRIEQLRARGLTHSLKKDKSSSKKKRKAEETDGNGEVKTAKMREPRQEQEMASKPPSQSDITSRINNAATASLTAKVLAEQEERNKRRKLAATAK
ncbi:uncharacterized protein CTHT_0046390 [Thermochaetoides thermophila DSM 1495]|uniref:Uncharacterized protein n=1 Tax=Chaetomium thermophilum (strain DSM 1495 / CBS 144.50 / IMI 039719) TaxID=759272 RepID=G0S9M1_CHATD|nr:hypothetical protein CTHT_0046390 [Thermochaetoides thermophila DSM 1495]EGS20132.1 hypothetical protein CTHT_0046390 [Thermochaetoides thermophila DSM 1495]